MKKAMYGICCKRFTGLKLNLESTECMSCSCDKHYCTPSYVLLASNVHPGPITFVQILSIWVDLPPAMPCMTLVQCAFL